MPSTDPEHRPAQDWRTLLAVYWVTSMVEGLGEGTKMRRDGKIVAVPFATAMIPFEREPEFAVAIPWGDVSTAYYSTGIPNIEVYTVVPEPQLTLLKISGYFGALLRTKLVQDFLQKLIPAGGPSDAERAAGKAYLWGEASDAAGKKVEARQICPEGYTLTALAALKIAEKILAGDFRAGFQTPARAYGADLILEIEGVRRMDN